MDRTEMEQLLVGYLYGELSPEERTIVEKEMAENPEWKEELESLRATSGLLRKWEDEDPGVRFVMTTVPEQRTARSLPRFLRVRGKHLWGAAAGVAAALLILSLNTSVSVDEGRVSLSFGRSPAPPLLLDPASEGIPLQLASGIDGPVGRDYITRDDFLRSQSELIRFVAALIRDSEDRQTSQFASTLQDYARDVETMHEGEMVFMEQRMGAVEQNTRDFLQTVDLQQIPPAGEDR